MLHKSCISHLRKAFVLTTGLFITTSTFGYYFWHIPNIEFYKKVSNALNLREKEREKERENEELISNSKTLNRLTERALMAKNYVNENGYDRSYCFLLDMRLPSGKSRFFVYNLEKDSVEKTGLVTHGKGSDKGPGALVFSNTPNSKCTSLGKYKIGKSYKGDFGLAYKLIGLDETNSKALDRFVVLHSFNGVPNNEVYPVPICVSEGCPTVSPGFLTQLKIYLDDAKAPILLWIYY